MGYRVCTCKMDISIDIKPGQECPDCHKPRRKDKVEHKGPRKNAAVRQQRKTKVTPPPENAGEVNSTRYMLDSRRDLHERHAETYGTLEKLEKAYKELQGKVTPPKWLTYEPPGIVVSSPKVPKNEPLEAEAVPAESATADPIDDPNLLADAFGVMTVRDETKTQYHGWNAVAEYILKIPGQDGDSNTPFSKPPTNETRLPSDLFLWNLTFPSPPTEQTYRLLFPNLPPQGHDPPLQSFLPLLPARERAAELMENYYSYFTWCASPVPLADLRAIFQRIYPNDGPLTALHISDVPSLGILLSVFLLGTLYDFQLDVETRTSDCEFFLGLARAAMACDPIIDHNTVPSIQAMILISWYIRLTPLPAPTYRSMQWAFSGYVSKLIQDAGLYRNSRDSRLFIQDEQQLQRGEQTFWEYHAQDIWQSFSFGRPPSMTSEFIQCKWPTQFEVHPGHASDYFTWKFSFSKLLSEVTNDIQVPIDEIEYTKILKGDRQLRRHGIPSNLDWPGDEPFPEGEAIGRTFQRWVVASLQNIAIMYWHRPFAWKAISEPYPLSVRHPYWRSVVSLFHSAKDIVTFGRKVWLVHPEVTTRLAPFWSHTLSAALCLGVMACLKPACLLAKGALMYFDQAVDMFVTAGSGIQHLSKQREQMLSIQKKAHDAFIENAAKEKRSSTSSPVASDISSEALSEFALSFNQQHQHLHHGFPGPGPSKLHESHLALHHLPAGDMPAEYDIYRHQEEGWDHYYSYK